MSYQPVRFHFDPATGQWQASLCASGEREHVAEGRGCSIEQAARRMAEEAKITSRMLNDRLRRTNV